jgi:hypothetical protein
MFRDVLSHPDHGGAFVARSKDGEWRALFHRDALSRLVWTPEPNFSPSYPFNGSSRILDFKEDSRVPMSWHWTRTDMLAAIREWMESAPAGLIATFQRLYPRGEPQMVPYLFEPRVNHSAQDHDVLKAIRELDSPEVGDSLKQAVISKLDSMGVIQIPEIGRYCPEYHEATEDFSPVQWQPVTDLRVGWMRDGRCLVKTVVGTKRN